MEHIRAFLISKALEAFVVILTPQPASFFKLQQVILHRVKEDGIPVFQQIFNKYLLWNRGVGG